jgi:hypothetical protein
VEGVECIGELPMINNVKRKGDLLSEMFILVEDGEGVFALQLGEFCRLVLL